MTHLSLLQTFVPFTFRGFWMGDSKTCKALRFVPATENLASTEDIEKLEALLGLNEIMLSHMFDF